MLNIHTLWTLAVAEMRTCRRMIRTWVFIAVTFFVCIWGYWDIVDVIGWPGPPRYWLDQMTDRYTISTTMNVFVAIFSIGMLFLMFDARIRDDRNRMSDVIDSLPASNIEILIGRLSGVLIFFLFFCLLFLGLLTGYEIVVERVGSRFHLGIPPISVLSFITWNLIPNLIFFGALVACLVSFVRFRLFIAAIALSLIYGFNWIEDYIPIRFQESLSLFGGSAQVPSDLAPVFVSPAIIGNKCAILFVSIALLLFSACIFPRIDELRRKSTIFGIVASATAVFIFWGLITLVPGTENRQEAWVMEHRQLDPSSFPDVQHLEGTIDLRPGRIIILDVTLSVHKPTLNTTDSVILSLNPGYKIQQLFVDGEETTAHSFNDGILKLPNDLLPDLSHDIRVRAFGKLDDRFAYLDQEQDFQQFPNRAARQLGLRNHIFHRDYVALMPGVVWYPISGSVVDRDEPEFQKRDLFTTDLKITVPQKWHVATVGKRKVDESQQRTMYRFRSEAPVPEIALLASKFDQRATTIEGIEFEILFSKKHLQNLDALSPLTDLINRWVAERISNAHAASLIYPYKAFYVVEIPSNLRIYGGGWRMDTVLQPPGMMLIRESNFPTERFKEVVARERSYGWYSKDEQDERIFDYVLKYFRDDGHGGSPFVGFARNFVSHQVSATGRGATVLQNLLEQLSNQLTTKTDSYSIITLAEFGTSIASVDWSQTPEDDFNSFAFQTRAELAAIPSTWKVMNQTALFDLDFSAEPIPSQRTLLVKGRALARSMIDYYGADKIGSFLDQLVQHHRAHGFTVAEFLDVATDVGLDFNEWVISWLEDTALPGYITTTPSVSKLEKPVDGDTNYHTSFVLHNAEPMPGLVRIFWEDRREPEENEFRRGWPRGEYFDSGPLFLKGIQSKKIAISSVHPLGGIWIEPYLSHNRAVFEVLVPPAADSIVTEIPVVPIATDDDWQPPVTDVVIVDDLDPNFRIVKRTDESQVFSVSKTLDPPLYSGQEYDQGLLLSSGIRFGVWCRLYDSSYYGLYRRTAVPIVKGDQNSAARFVANLPYNGKWTLEIYLPKGAFSSIYYGGWQEFLGIVFDDNRFVSRTANPDVPEEHYRLTIKDGSAERNEKFDVANATEGWNEVRTFELSSTEVEVLLSAWAGHEEIMVFADAIRWTPVSDTAENEESSP
ncbi:MAG: hypothetical protein OXH31_06275 [Gammaproteobacteria bacterium]|nr:hypothetical protein [Gammaproteobacteria bacterium]